MKCPNCNQKPVSLIRFIFKSKRTVTCQHCEKTLSAGRFVPIIGFIVGSGFGISTVLFVHSVTTERSASAFGFGKLFLLFAVFVIAFEYITWHYGRYETEDSGDQMLTEKSGDHGR